MAANALIAVDFDDVICQTNRAVCEWHNDTFGTDLNLRDFHYYHYWKNPGWGSPKQTLQKVLQFYASPMFLGAEPVKGALEALQELHKTGYRLAIVTARSTIHRAESEAWLNRWFPNLFESIYFTGEFQQMRHQLNESSTSGYHTKVTKAQICRQINASLLIDDCSEHVIACSNLNPPLPALLFGEYEWTGRLSTLGGPLDMLSYDERMERDPGNRWWETDLLQLPSGVPVWRVKSWDAILHWMSKEGLDILEKGSAA